MAPIADRDLHDLVCRDAARGWERFIESHTRTIVALIQRAGVRDRDETMEVYTLVCERLVAGDCARIRRWDPGRGQIASWLGVVVRRVIVDWVRSRAGRRRLFGAVEALDPFVRHVFELFYWHDRTTAEIAGELTAKLGRPVGVSEVLGALDEVHTVMTARHFAELASMSARSRPPVSLDAEVEDRGFDPVDPSGGPDVEAVAREQHARLDAALAALPHEDAAIVRLHFGQGLTLGEVGRALHVPSVTRVRVERILDVLRRSLALGQPASSPLPSSAEGGSRA